MVIFKVYFPLFHVCPLCVILAFEVMCGSISTCCKFLIEGVTGFCTKVHFWGMESLENRAENAFFPVVSDGSSSSGSQFSSPMTILQLSHLQSTALCPQPRIISSSKHPEIKEHQEITAENCCSVIYWTYCLPWSPNQHHMYKKQHLWKKLQNTYNYQSGWPWTAHSC